MSMKVFIASQNGHKIVRKTVWAIKKKRKRKILLGNVLETPIVNELPILVNFPIESLFLITVL